MVRTKGWRRLATSPANRRKRAPDVDHTSALRTVTVATSFGRHTLRAFAGVAPAP